jgi:hypothetical protein
MVCEPRSNPICFQQLFAGKFDHLEEKPRANFDDMFMACLTVFTVITGDDWTRMMSRTYQVCAPPCRFVDLRWQAAGSSAIVYFLLLITLGAYIIINMFISIILEGA